MKFSIRQQEYTSGSIEHNSGCFKLLNEDVLAYINTHKTQITYLKGKTIFKQGHENKSVFDWHTWAILLAFTSVFGENIYTYSALALKDAEICMIEKEALQ